AAGERGEARSPETGDGRAPAGSDGRIEVRRLGAVDADDDDRIAWITVGAAIDGDRGPRGHGRHGYYYGGVAGRGRGIFPARRARRRAPSTTRTPSSTASTAA